MTEHSMGAANAAEVLELSSPGEPNLEPPNDDLLLSFAYIAKGYGDERTLTSWRQGLPVGLKSVTHEAVITAATGAGFVAAVVERQLSEVADYLLPVIVISSDGHGCVWSGRTAEGNAQVALPEAGQVMLPVEMPMEKLQELASGFLIFIKPPLRHDDRVDAQLEPPETHWFWGTLWRFKSYYANTVFAAILVNVLALAGTFFTMNVYDRVVPNQAYVTLWSLAIGVLVAMSFEFTGRQLRSYLVDIAGKKADLVLGAMLFRHMQDLRLEAKPPSAGSFASQLTAFESLRDFATSATVAAITDLPFVLLFMVVIGSIGGVLVCVPLVVVPIVVTIAFALQKPLSRHMAENMREGSLKQGLLIETIDGMETLKAINGQGHMQKRWEDYCAMASASSLKSRVLTSWAVNFVSFVQQLVTVLIVVWGVYLIGDGLLSMGTLIGVVILSGRAVSPLAQIVGLGVRFQQARVSLKMLNGLMEIPTDREKHKQYLPRTRFQGALKVDALSFTYPQQKSPALEWVNINILPGERIAILGRIGSGKSTLLRLLNGLYQPASGSVYADDIDLRQIDPADVHHNIGLVTQDCHLFYGTLRENIMMAAPAATPDEFLEVARLTGLDAFAARHPMGFEMQVGEGGVALSGGQRQVVALARCLLAKTQILLMDEPTSAMDGQTESAFIAKLLQTLGDRTLIVATHRMSLLALVNRVIILDNGKVVADGPKEKVLNALSPGAKQPGAEL